MPERNGAAVEIDLFQVEAGFLNDGERLNGEGFVQLNDVDIFEPEFGEPEGARDRDYRADAHYLRRDPTGRETDEASFRFQAQLFGFGVGHHEGGRGAVACLRRVAR